MNQRIYCSEQNHHEPMIGTADPVDVWVLLEYRPAWKPRALEQSSLGPRVRRWLDDNIAALAQIGMKARPQLVRQPEIDSDQVRLLVGLPGHLLSFSGSGYGFLDAVDLVSVVRAPSAHPSLPAPQYFVCTNGQRDLCCARFGLPVYAALRERLGDRVWQITHLGGHRFAPNVLAMPQGVVYGRVGVQALDDFVAAVEDGRLAFAYLRGRSWYPPPVQAAEAVSGDSTLRYLEMRGDAAAAAVTFASGSGRRVIRVRQAPEPITVLKSCGDEREQPVRPYLPD